MEEECDMELDKKIDSSFSRVKQEFPFTDYINNSVYHVMRMVLQQLGKTLSDFKGKHLLDIGCGPMDKTRIFQLMGFNCYGVDDLGDSWHKRNGNTARINRMGITRYRSKRVRSMSCVRLM